jgi:hypothetical protein
VTAPAEFDVRDILDAGRERQRAEDDWLAAHAGALAASQVGGCLRREKFRLLGAPRAEAESAGMLRRFRWGLMYQDDVYRQALNAGRRPRRDVPIELEVDGTNLRGVADLVFTEGVVECKTTSAWEMHEEHLPFAHLVQLGVYMLGLQRPGQLLYATFHREWAFDFPAVPEIVETWIRHVTRLFGEHPGPDPLPFPPERLYCDSCAYLSICPTDPGTAPDAPLNPVEQQIVDRYLAAAAQARPAEKRMQEAKAALLGLREVRGQEQSSTILTVPGWKLTITESIQQRTDFASIPPEVKAGLPTKLTTTTRITITKEN